MRNKTTLKIGLTGNIGSGKTTIVRLFEVLGVPVFYADAVAKSFLVDPLVKQKIVLAFGSQVEGANGIIDRKILAHIVFNDPAKLALLNSIIHPVVRVAFLNWIDGMVNYDYAIMEAAILFESGFAENFDKTIVVSAPLQQRIQRVMLRDSASHDEVMARVRYQMPEEKLTELADFVIVNDNHRLVLPKVLEIDKILRDLARFS